MTVRIAERRAAAEPVFRDRTDAGVRLAAFVDPERNPEAVVLALPRGGVPVARPLARSLGCRFEPVIVRKLPVPCSPEMGFGAVAIDGTSVLNERVIRMFSLPGDTVKRVIRDVRREISRRAREYVGHDAPPEVEGRHVYIVDDGLATGYSMISAARMVASRKPRSMTLAVPVAPVSALAAMEEHFHDRYCLVAQDRSPFAVASFYMDFHEMSDREVRDLLR